MQTPEAASLERASTLFLVRVGEGVRAIASRRRRFSWLRGSDCEGCGSGSLVKIGDPGGGVLRRRRGESGGVSQTVGDLGGASGGGEESWAGVIARHFAARSVPSTLLSERDRFRSVGIRDMVCSLAHLALLLSCFECCCCVLDRRHTSGSARVGAENNLGVASWHQEGQSSPKP
jgi:hypothetical protein